MNERPSNEAAPLPREIERKYLLSAVPERALEVPAATLAQGYVPGVRIHERLRRETEAGVVRLVRTIKLGRGVERIEVEEDVDPALFERLWPLTEGARVAKHRHRVPDGERIWEIDVFTDRPLVLAEIELASADEAVVFPEWLSRYVVREVTDDPTYLNLHLAR